MLFCWLRARGHRDHLCHVYASSSVHLMSKVNDIDPQAWLGPMSSPGLPRQWARSRACMNFCPLELESPVPRNRARVTYAAEQGVFRQDHATALLLKWKKQLNRIIRFSP